MKILTIALIVALVVTGIACNSDTSDDLESFANTIKTIKSVTTPTPTTLIDESVFIKSGYQIKWDMLQGNYTVKITSNDALEIEWMGSNLSTQNTQVPTKTYVRNIYASEKTTLVVSNPSGILNNPNATAHIKIIKTN